MHLQGVNKPPIPSNLINIVELLWTVYTVLIGLTTDKVVVHAFSVNILTTVVIIQNIAD